MINSRLLHSVMKKLGLLAAFCLILGSATAQPVMERLDRGLVAIKSGNTVFLSWRLLGDEAYETAFNIYRDDVKITDSPVSSKTNYVDASGTTSATYYVTPVVDGTEGEPSKVISVMDSWVKRIDIQRPATVGTPDVDADRDINGDGEIGTLGQESPGSNYQYSPNDCSIGDLDGDGEYEIVLKWDPSNSHDNMPTSYNTGKVYFDAYKMDGTLMWRIDCGINIRAGAHITQFLVYDFDLDGRAELAFRTAPGTKDGLGNYLSTGPAATDDDSKDYRGAVVSGMVVSGPEYLTVFNGISGAEMATVALQPERGKMALWGDDWGNRVDRFTAGVAYLDGVNPSMIIGRGYYHGSSGFKAKTGVAAFSFNGIDIINEWTFWADETTGENVKYVGQGCHSLSIGDVDQDGFDEVIYGSMTVDNDGTGLYSTDLRHGDALHVSDMDPDRPGLEVYQVHEESGVAYGMSFRDAKTGEVIWGFDSDGDVGRGVAADIDPNHRGFESWSSMNNGVYDCKGNKIWDVLPQGTSGGNAPSYNHIVYWDGDLCSEILDRGVLNKFNYTTGGTDRLKTLYNEGVSTNNSTKNNPCLTADLWGDWREEIIMRSSDNEQLVIFTTTDETKHKLYTLMSDPMYRVAIAWQNGGYNQPPHAGYYIAEDMDSVPTPNITVWGSADQNFYSFTSTVDGSGYVSLVDGKYVEGNLSIAAKAEEGWVFDHWEGDLTGTDNPIEITLDKDMSVTAFFIQEDPNTWNTYEAEDGAWSDGLIQDVIDGEVTTDGKMVNTTNAVGEWIEISAFAASADVYTIKLIYANGGSTDRPVSVAVGGTTQIENQTMPATGSWSTWGTVTSEVTFAEGWNTIRFTALTTGGIPNLDRIEVIIGSATGVDDIEMASLIKCYPTVVNNNFYLKYTGSSDKIQVSIINLNGIMCMNKTMNNSNQTITLDASELTSGMYLVKVQTREGTLTQKIIKQ